MGTQFLRMVHYFFCYLWLISSYFLKSFSFPDMYIDLFIRDIVYACLYDDSWTCKIGYSSRRYIENRFNIVFVLILLLALD